MYPLLVLGEFRPRSIRLITTVDGAPKRPEPRMDAAVFRQPVLNHKTLEANLALKRFSRVVVPHVLFHLFRSVKTRPANLTAVIFHPQVDQFVSFQHPFRPELLRALRTVKPEPLVVFPHVHIEGLLQPERQRAIRAGKLPLRVVDVLVVL